MADNFKEDYKGSMDSKYSFSAERVGATTSVQSPNQIGELTSRLNQGLKTVEIGAMNQRLLDQVPKEHFTEMRRLNELTGSGASMHAPIQDLDLAGFTQEGWSEIERQNSKEKLKSVLDKAHILNPEGDIPVTVHAGGMPAQSWQKEGLKTEEGKPIEDSRSEMMIVNQDSGQVQKVKYKERKYFGGGEQVWTPEMSLNNLNQNEWDRDKLQIMQWKKGMNEVDDRVNMIKERAGYGDLEVLDKNKLLTLSEKNKFGQVQQEIKDSEDFREETFRNIRSVLEDMNDRFERFGDRENPKYLEFKEVFERSNFEQKEKEVKGYANQLKDFEKQLKGKKITDEQRAKYLQIGDALENARREQSEDLVRAAEVLPAPETWKPIDDFAKEKASNTVAEAAFDAFKKYGKKTPVISMENVYPEFPLSRAHTLKKTVEDARDKFAEKLIKDKKMGKELAKDTAEKLIGVTWDVGHIYMLKKYGYSDEDIRKEAKRIAPYVKHAHLTDNFGFEDSHLPPGLGDVNIKAQLKELEKKGFKGKSIVEAGEFVANFKEVPHLYALEHLGSPLYPDKAGPLWEDIAETSGHYFSGYGEMMPQKYFDLYGAPGFSQLPAALGGGGAAGNIPDKGRFAMGAEEEEDNTAV